MFAPGLKNAAAQYRELIHTTLTTALVGLFFGVVMAIVSNAFVLGVRKIAALRDNADLFAVTLGDVTVPLLPTISLLLAVCGIMLIRRFFAITAWKGPADAIYAAHRNDNELDVKAGFGSTLAAFVSASGGASVGQYGPLVHFGATLGSFVQHRLRLGLTTDVYIGCGVAGAIAAGFNAPIAAIVFAHEAILRHFSLRTVAPIAISSISAASLSSWALGGKRLFQIEAMPVPLLTLMVVALVSGPIFGLLAVIYMHAIRFAQRYAQQTTLSTLRKLLIAAIGTGIVGTMMPELFGFGIREILLMLKGQFSTDMLLLLLAGKILLTALCLGFGLFGGVFSPALFVGAAGGSIAHRLLVIAGISTIPASALVTCGMAAVASAVIGAPIAGVLIMLELTMSYEYALAAMLSVVMSAMVAYPLFGMSFFDRQLLDRGIDISQGRGGLQVMETYIEPMVSQDYLTIDQNTTVRDAIEMMAKDGTSEAYILDENNIFIGKLGLHELLRAPAEAPVRQHIMKDPIHLKRDASLLQAIEVASTFVGEHIPVIDLDTGVMIGIVTEADLFQAYLDLQTSIVDLERR